MFYTLLSLSAFFFFFFNDTATTEIYTLSLHDALPISQQSIAPRVYSPGCHSSVGGPERFGDRRLYRHEDVAASGDAGRDRPSAAGDRAHRVRFARRVLSEAPFGPAPARGRTTRIHVRPGGHRRARADL